MKLIEAYTLFQVIQKLISDSKPRSVKFGYVLSVNLAKLMPHAKAFEDARTKAIDTYSEKDAEGNPETKDNLYVMRDQDGFNREMRELQDTELDDLTLTQIDLDACPEEMEPAFVQILLPMLKEPA